jgi:hypothetical protein
MQFKLTWQDSRGGFHDVIVESDDYFKALLVGGIEGVQPHEIVSLATTLPEEYGGDGQTWIKIRTWEKQNAQQD